MMVDIPMKNQMGSLISSQLLWWPQFRKVEIVRLYQWCLLYGNTELFQIVKVVDELERSLNGNTIYIFGPKMRFHLLLLYVLSSFESIVLSGIEINTLNEFDFSDIKVWWRGTVVFSDLEKLPQLGTLIHRLDY